MNHVFFCQSVQKFHDYFAIAETMTFSKEAHQMLKISTERDSFSCLKENVAQG